MDFDYSAAGLCGIFDLIPYAKFLGDIRVCVEHWPGLLIFEVQGQRRLTVNLRFF